MSFFENLYSFPIVADAAGVKYPAAAKWVERGDLVMRPEDRQVIGRGGRKMLSPNTSLQFILAAELNRRGLKTSEACEAALNFAHYGQIKGQKGAAMNRNPGRLFVNGLTLLFIDRENPDRSSVEHFSGLERVKEISTRLDAVYLEWLFLSRLGMLGIDAVAAVQEMKE